MLKAALNGSRSPDAHAALPTTASALAVDASACVRAGAGAIHMHPRSDDGRESLDPDVIDRAVQTVRTVTRAPIGVSTGAWIEPDPERRAALVRRWHEPDMASVNLSEAGAPLVAAALMDAGIGVEAGVWSVEDAERLRAGGLADKVTRVLVEIVHPIADPAAEARRIDVALDRLGIRVPRLHHGEGEATWPVLYQAVTLGHDIRIGFEDTLALPNGDTADSNESLVRAAIEVAHR